MGIESDQLVFDYLSRVGDLAQQRGLPAATRMRLVTGLRARIDGEKPDSVSGAKRLLARLGTPEAVVAQAAGDPQAAGAPPPAAPSPDGGPPARWAAAREKLGGLSWRGALTGRGTAGGHPPANGAAGAKGAAGGASAKGKASAHGKVPAPREGAQGPAPAVPVPDAGLPPHLAGADELGDAQDAPDWWRVESSPFGPGETVPGFVGGIEIPEIWDRPEHADTKDGKDGKDGEAGGGRTGGGGGPLSLRKRGGAGGDGDTAEGAGAEAADAADGQGPPPGLLRRALARRRAAAAGARPVGTAGEDDEDDESGPEAAADAALPLRAWLSPVPTLAVLLLVAGAVLGSWLALAGGWALAYVSRRLTPAEAKFAALGVPGSAAGGLVVWLWGRFDGRWGDPIAQGRLGQELLDGLPVMARAAAVASALFLVWRMRRAAR
ncbi:hypothetical protein ACWD6P_32770 [Streptomyces sp. NPDC002446]